MRVTVSRTAAVQCWCRIRSASEQCGSRHWPLDRRLCLPAPSLLSTGADDETTRIFTMRGEGPYLARAFSLLKVESAYQRFHN